MLRHSLRSILITLISLLLVSSIASAASDFTGRWYTVDSIDGSDIYVQFSGVNRSTDTVRVTWRESFFTTCDGAPGIVRGTGTVDEFDADILHVDLTLTCFTTGVSLNFTGEFFYDRATDTLTSNIAGTAFGFTRG